MSGIKKKGGKIYIPCRNSFFTAAVTRIRTWVTSATTKGTNHYTITALMATASLDYILINVEKCKIGTREIVSES